jgi:hypothetical protein
MVVRPDGRVCGSYVKIVDGPRRPDAEHRGNRRRYGLPFQFRIIAIAGGPAVCVFRRKR